MNAMPIRLSLVRYLYPTSILINHGRYTLFNSIRILPSLNFCTHRINSEKFNSKPSNNAKADSNVYSRSRALLNTISFKLTGGLGVKGLWKKYGFPFAVWYSTLYFGGMGIFYVLIENGLLGSNLISWIQMTPISEYIDLATIEKYGAAGGAIVLNELFEIIRLPLAVITIPYIKKWWDGDAKSTYQNSKNKALLKSGEKKAKE